MKHIIENLHDKYFYKYHSLLDSFEFEKAEFWRGKLSAMEELMKIINENEKLEKEMTDSLKALATKFNKH